MGSSRGSKKEEQGEVSGSRLDNRTYYDLFSHGYDRSRGWGYHWMLDTLESEVLLPLVQDRDVLELGCGTGLIMDRISDRCRTLVGVDISLGMLERARGRGHRRVVQASVEQLPFQDATFDVVYSFKVLAHVERVDRALEEAARVLRPGGWFVADFYNPWSMRGLIKRFGPAGRIARRAHEKQVYTRFDTPSRIRGLLPDSLTIEEFRGVRVLTPWSGVFRVPGTTSVLTKLERAAGRSPLLWRLGGFLVAVARKHGGQRPGEQPS